MFIILFFLIVGYMIDVNKFVQWLVLLLFFSFYSILQCFFFNLSFLKDLLTFYSLIPHFCALIFFTVFYNFYSYRTIHICVYIHRQMCLCVYGTSIAMILFLLIYLFIFTSFHNVSSLLTSVLSDWLSKGELTWFHSAYSLKRKTGIKN